MTAELLGEYTLKLLLSKVKHGRATLEPALLDNMEIVANDYDPPLSEVSVELEETLTTLFFSLSKYRKLIDFSVSCAGITFDAPAMTNSVWRTSIRKERLDWRKLCENVDEMEIVLTAIKGLENTHWYGYVNGQKPQIKLEFIGSASAVKVIPTISTRIEALCAVWENKCYITKIISINYPSESDFSLGGSDQLMWIE